MVLVISTQMTLVLRAFSEQGIVMEKKSTPVTWALPSLSGARVRASSSAALIRTCSAAVRAPMCWWAAAYSGIWVLGQQGVAQGIKVSA